MMPDEFPSFENGLSLLPPVVHCWGVATDKSSCCGKKSVNKPVDTQHNRAVIVDSQSLKTTELACEVGDDAAKLVKGHKQHLKSRSSRAAAPSRSECCQSQRKS